MVVGPIVANGIDSFDVSVLSTDIFALNHSSYADTRELLEDVHRLLLTGERPPHVRSNNLHQWLRDGRVFWRYE